MHPGHVGTACLLSSSFLESGNDIGVVTLPIMGRNSRQTIGKVRGKFFFFFFSSNIYLWQSEIQNLHRFMTSLSFLLYVCQNLCILWMYKDVNLLIHFSGLPGNPTHPGTAVWHELFIHQVLEKERYFGCGSQGSRQHPCSQVSDDL